MGRKVEFYNAASSEVFGDIEVANYREAYGLFACSGILFNHDSPLRPERFVTQKRPVRCGLRQGRRISCIWVISDIQRDWGWAEDYVVAMYLMMQQEQSDDYVIATGESYKLALFIEIAFRLVGLDWREYVVSDKKLCRPTDLAVSRGNPAKAKEKLGWVAQHKIADIVRLMILHRRGSANEAKKDR